MERCSSVIFSLYILSAFALNFPFDFNKPFEAPPLHESRKDLSASDLKFLKGKVLRAGFLSFSEAVGKLWNKAKEFVAGEETTEKLRRTARRISEHGRKTSQKVTKIAEDLTEESGKVALKLQKTAQDLTENGVQTARTLQKTAADLISGNGEDFARQLQQTAENFSAKAGEAADQIRSAAKDLTSRDGEAARRALQKTAQNIAENGRGIVRQLTDLAVEYTRSTGPIFIGNETASDIKKALTLLDSDCPQKCGKPDVIRAVRYGSSATFDRLYEKLKFKNKKCAENILKNLSEFMEREEGAPANCFGKKRRLHRANAALCKKMTHDIGILKNRVTALTAVAYGEEERTQALSLCMECLSGKGEERSLKEFLDSLEPVKQCMELKEGEVKQITPETPIRSSYNVKKERDGSHTIPLTLAFAAASDYDGDVPKDQVPARYMKQTQDCMEKANSALLGPNGEKLQIVISPPSDQAASNGRDCNEIKKILVGSKEHRSNSNKYEADIDCETIAHEILHLAGVCDSYEERLKGVQTDPQTGRMIYVPNKYVTPSGPANNEVADAFDCRVLQGNNIMANHYEKWNNVFKHGLDKSLITPGQFNSILYGSCEKKNKVFNECSKLAYESSKINPGCLAEKEKCDKLNIHGLNKQRELDRLSKAVALQTSGLKKFERARRERRNLILTRNGVTRTLRPTDPEYDEQFEKAVNHKREKLDSLNRELKTVKSWPDNETDSA